jgi:hypothetical protein
VELDHGHPRELAPAYLRAPGSRGRSCFAPGAEMAEPPTDVAVGRCCFLRVTGRGVRSAVVWLREGTCQGLRGRSARHLMPFHASARVLLLEFTAG